MEPKSDQPNPNQPEFQAYRTEEYNGQSPASRIIRLYKILDFLTQNEPLNSSEISLGCVGIGYEAGDAVFPWYQQSYEPYVLAGWVHSELGKKLSMTLIDPIVPAIKGIKEKKGIYLDVGALADPELLQCWQRLARDMENDQIQRLTENDGGLTTIHTDDESDFNHTYRISLGMDRISIPPWFQDLIDSGNIKLICDDVRDTATAPIHDLMFCLNVLLHYPQSDQKIILNKLIAKLKPGGALVVNDSQPDPERKLLTGFRQPLFEQFGGWINQSELQNHNIQTARVFDDSVFILKKGSK